jgi:DeoR/GlpR family transcriptional regulator of sugar metabolism
VSKVTIRHDLAELAEHGWIARVHGGAAVVLQNEQPLSARESQHIAEKVGVAQAAARLVTSGDRIALDSSSTAYQLALQLTRRADLNHLTIVTNNVQIAMAVAPSPGIDVLLIGGFVRAETWSAVGPTTEAMISTVHVHRGFFGAAGITLKRGLTDADIREVQVKQALMRSVDEITVLVDSSKFGTESFSTTIELQAVHRLITDSHISSEYAAIIRSLGIELVVVS